MASILVAGLLGYGDESNSLWKSFEHNKTALKARRSYPENPDDALLEAEDAKNWDLMRQELWQDSTMGVPHVINAMPCATNTQIESSDEVAALALDLFCQAIFIVAGAVDDTKILPFMNFICSFLWSTTYIPGGFGRIQSYFPWTRLVTFLNALIRKYDLQAAIDLPFEHPAKSFFAVYSRQMPEDADMRGLVWWRYVFPPGFFTEEDSNTVEESINDQVRAYRCLWLARQVASVSLDLCDDRSCNNC